MRGQSESWSWKDRLDADPAAEARNAMKAHNAVSNKADTSLARQFCCGSFQNECLRRQI